MRIDAYIGNPDIANHEQYYELEELLHEIEPRLPSGTSAPQSANY